MPKIKFRHLAASRIFDQLKVRHGKFTASIFLGSVLYFATTIVAVETVEARRGGRFESSFSRGIPHSGGGQKSYGSDTLSVSQLTECLKKADALDTDSNAIEADRSLTQVKFVEIDAMKLKLERLQLTLDRYSQLAIDRFNADVNRYNALIAEGRSTQAVFNQRIQDHNSSTNSCNAACTKKYYADDLEAAKRSIGLE